MNVDYKKILPHVGLVLGTLFLIGGLFALVRSEEAKTRDTIRMQEVLSIKQGLYRYYRDHAAYPPAHGGPIVLGERDSNCLNEKGYFSDVSKECTNPAYQRPVPVGFGLGEDDRYIYHALAEQGTTPCTSALACPRYGLQFYTETNLYAPKGTHWLTPEGMK